VADPGRWRVHAGRSGILFRQDLRTPFGVNYVYAKKLQLDRHAPVLVIDHALKNAGREPMEVLVFNHDFFMLDRTPTGPDTVVRFPFAPVPDVPLKNGARVEGNRIVFDRRLETGESVFAHLGGFSGAASDFDFTVENRATGVGVEETGSLPLARVVFWSARTTICPEGYVKVGIPPGQTAHWQIRYRFYAR
jgi:hypothetical protein